MNSNKLQSNLFSNDNSTSPLADRMRPEQLQDYIGQQHLLGVDKPLRRAIETGQLHSMVFWGPPGTGKTTLARMISHYCEAHFISISAVLSGVKEIRAAIEQAKQIQQTSSKRSVLFVDEAHRFNKSQQDAFLPYIEDGTVFFIGATTENPSFELNNALLSRVRTYVLKNINDDEIVEILNRALSHEKGLAKFNISIEPSLLCAIAKFSDGDARRALNILEIASDLAESREDKIIITDEIVHEVTQQATRRFDKGGDIFYEQISALHKSVRGSDPDAALYWFCRMLDGGCDPIYIARRVVRMASEDIGNADPRGLPLALNAWETYQRLGSPEGELAIAQAIVYLACAAKSNAVYSAFNAAMQSAKESGSLEVPKHLRNAVTSLMKQLDYGRDYQYSHEQDDAYSAEQHYFPDEMKEQIFYQPVPRGLEIKIAERLNELRQRRVAKDHKKNKTNG